MAEVRDGSIRLCGGEDSFEEPLSPCHKVVRAAPCNGGENLKVRLVLDLDIGDQYVRRKRLMKEELGKEKRKKKETR